MIASTKRYAPIVTLPTNGNTKLLENIKQGFKKQFPGINNLDY